MGSRLTSGILLVASVSFALPARALPGAHGPSISTFDTRSSTVVLAYRHGLGDATFRTLSYNANFTATTGNFSAQFGAHYLQFRDVPGVDLAHGAGASGVGLFSIPVASRFDNGVPRAAIALFLGATPTATVSGFRNFLTAPLVLGTGVPLSPARWFTLTPWFEAAPSVNWDTFVDPDGIEFTQEAQLLPNGDIRVVSPDVDEALDEAIDSQLSFRTAMKVGVDATLRLGDDWDFNTYAAYTSLGSLFSGSKVLQLGGGLAYHWDDVVSAVQPARERLSQESCEAVEERFRMCPQYQERLRTVPPSSTPSEPGRSSPPTDPSRPLQAPPAPPAPREAPPPTPAAPKVPPPAPAPPAPPVPPAGQGPPAGSFPPPP